MGSTVMSTASAANSTTSRFFKRREKGIENSILEARGTAVPIHRKARHNTSPTWTLSNTQLAKRPPIVKLDTCSFHILDAENRGSNCLVTIRKLDEESSRFTSLEAKSRTGVLGRIFDGVWMKLLHVSYDWVRFECVFCCLFVFITDG